MRGRATLIGTFAPASRTWGWGGTNPHAPDAVRRASARLVDDVVDRDMWELSTPVFATDEVTAWALAAFVCDRASGDGVYCSPDDEGLVFVLLRDFAAVPYEIALGGAYRSCLVWRATAVGAAGRVTPVDVVRREVRAEHVARDDVGLHLPRRPVDDERRRWRPGARPAAGAPARSR